MQECEKLTMAQNDYVLPYHGDKKLLKTNTMTNTGKDKPKSKLEWETRNV
jgi:hypothetical protein